MSNENADVEATKDNIKSASNKRKEQINMSNIPRLIGNIILVFSIFIPVIVIEYCVTPPKTGFYCHDPRYSLPRLPHKLNDVVLVLVYVVAPFILLVIMESIQFMNKTEPQVNPMPSATNQICGRTCVNPKIQSNLKILSAYVYGFGATLLVTDVGKYFLGRLRPHFFDACKPDWSKINCTQNQFITNYTCTDKSRIPQIYLSFPSGHASLSSYGMIFLVIYFQYKFVIKRPFLLRPAIQTIALIACFYCSTSRVLDHNHSWGDVLVGSLIGSFFACLMLFASLQKKDLRAEKNIENGMQQENSSHLLNSIGKKVSYYETADIDIENQKDLC